MAPVIIRISYELENHKLEIKCCANKSIFEEIDIL